MNVMFRFGAGLAVLAFALTTNADVPVPAPGASARIDAIKKARVLRVGVLANAPWLVENTSGSGETWSGPAWLLANEYAKRLKVKLEAVPVSHETKVPVLASNQVDISVTPLAETPDRLKVVDFVIYSSTSVCMFGLASNKKFASAKSVDDLIKPEITIAYYTGGGEEGWVKERFPKAPRHATQQDMHAAITLAREEQRQKRATDEAGCAGGEGGGWCCDHGVHAGGRGRPRVSFSDIPKRSKYG